MPSMRCHDDLGMPLHDARRAMPPSRVRRPATSSMLRIIASRSISCTSNGWPMPLQQHDRQPAAEVLAELRRARAATRPGSSGVVERAARAPARTAASPSAPEQLDDPPPVGAPAGTRRDARRSCRARCRSPTASPCRSRWSVSCSSLCAAQWPKSSGRDEPSSNGSPPVAMCAQVQRRRAADHLLHRRQVARPRARAACCSRKSKNAASRISADLDRFRDAAAPVAIGQRRQEARSR